MGLLDDLIKLSDPADFTGNQAREDIRSAGDAQSQANQAALAEIIRQFDVTQGNLQPFLDAGTGALGRVEQGSTIGGLGEMLSQILGGDTFQSLIGERTRGVQGQLASSGLRRSGEGISQAADIGSDLALQIEQLLFGRNVNLAGSGQNAAAGLGAFGQTAAQDQASLLGQQGAISANTLLGLSQNRQQSGQNIATGLAAIFSPEPARLTFLPNNSCKL